MAKKIPMRKCVATGELCPKQELLRVVKNNEGIVAVDLTGKMNGHGAYLKKSKEALDAAIKKKSLNKALEIDIPEVIYDEIEKIINGK
ncbi:MAG: YlxR family protein [Bacilli bacterium]|nr:YlxR family protein [Bacilli bacterium]